MTTVRSPTRDSKSGVTADWTSWVPEPVKSYYNDKVLSGAFEKFPEQRACITRLVTDSRMESVYAALKKLRPVLSAEGWHRLLIEASLEASYGRDSYVVGPLAIRDTLREIKKLSAKLAEKLREFEDKSSGLDLPYSDSAPLVDTYRLLTSLYGGDSSILERLRDIKKESGDGRTGSLATPAELAEALSECAWKLHELKSEEFQPENPITLARKVAKGNPARFRAAFKARCKRCDELRMVCALSKSALNTLALVALDAKGTRWRKPGAGRRKKQLVSS